MAAGVFFAIGSRFGDQLVEIQRAERQKAYSVVKEDPSVFPARLKTKRHSTDCVCVVSGTISNGISLNHEMQRRDLKFIDYISVLE